MEIHDSVLDLIGNTPLVNLKQVAKDKPCKVVVKAEMTNPGGSSKDRPAVSMICLLYTSPSPRDISGSRMPSSA